MKGRIDLPGGWYLIRDDRRSKPTYREWFLSNPRGIWVAKFWDGPQAGANDVAEFAAALASGIEAFGQDPKELDREATRARPDAQDHLEESR